MNSKNSKLGLSAQVFATVVAMSFVAMAAVAAEPTAEQIEFFEAKVRPIFVEHCYECHSTTAADVEANLLLDSRWGWETGGDSGPAIVPGLLDESLVIEAVRYEDDIVSAMPPRSKLAAKDIRTLEKWVEMGAPDPRERPAETGKIETFDLNKRRLEHWSWCPISNPRPPQVSDETWPNNDIDRFVLSKIESAGLTPASD
ncbi:MAG: c-type cytochrome domain-containing protein, partial [Rubripirellula sp.]